MPAGYSCYSIVLTWIFKIHKIPSKYMNKNVWWHYAFPYNFTKNGFCHRCFPKIYTTKEGTSTFQKHNLPAAVGLKKQPLKNVAHKYVAKTSKSTFKAVIF